MAILKIRDANGNVQEIVAIRGEDGKDGEDYVLTEADKREIAEMVAASAVATVDTDTIDYALKTDIPDVSGFALKTEIPDVSGFALKTEIPSVPTKVSELTNDAGYLTQHQSLADYAKKTDIPNMDNYYTKGETDALYSTETWTFTLENGSTVTKTVVLK